MSTPSWYEELKRRRVFRALLAYGLVSFGVLQVVEPVMHGLDLPAWVLRAVVVGLGLLLPVVLVVAWIFDLKGGRIEATGPAPRPRVVLLLGVAGLLLAAPGVIWALRRPPPPEGPASIAVLPFADLSPGHDQDWMCDGIAEEILDALCSVTGLRVAARSSSFQFKGKSAGVREMALSLGVSTLLEGSVRKVDDRLRVSARLVSAEGYELWSDKFDRRVQDAFAIQEEIARAVVAALRVRMPSEEAGRLRRAGTANAEAWEMYLRGRQHFRLLGHENGELARQTFKRAIALDPGFAQARAGLADVDTNLVQWLLVPKGEQAALREEALASSEEALRLDPGLAEAHVGRGNLFSMLGRAAEADQSFRRATALAPGLRDAWYYYARFLFSVQRYADSARAYEEAARINPDDYDSLTLAAMPWRRLGDEARAEQAQRRSLEAAERVLQKSPDDVRALYLSGGSLIVLGDLARGKQRLEQAVSLRPHDFAVLYNAACGLARAGDKARALDLLDRAVGTGQGFRAWLAGDPDLDPLRDEPRFGEILARLPAEPAPPRQVRRVATGLGRPPSGRGLASATIHLGERTPRPDTRWRARRCRPDGGGAIRSYRHPHGGRGGRPMQKTWLASRSRLRLPGALPLALGFVLAACGTPRRDDPDAGNEPDGGAVVEEACGAAAGLACCPDGGCSGPGLECATVCFAQRPAEPAFAPRPGVYPGEVTLSMWSMNYLTNGRYIIRGPIYYTLDGSTPTTSSTLYTTKVTLAGDQSSWLVKAFSQGPGMLPSPVVTSYYRIDSAHVPGQYSATLTAADYAAAMVGTWIGYGSAMHPPFWLEMNVRFTFRADGTFLAESLTPNELHGAVMWIPPLHYQSSGSWWVASVAADGTASLGGIPFDPQEGANQVLHASLSADLEEMKLAWSPGYWGPWVLARVR